MKSRKERKVELTISWITIVRMEMILMDRSRGSLGSGVLTRHLVGRVHPLGEHIDLPGIGMVLGLGGWIIQV
jgi:hypothetical protein